MTRTLTLFLNQILLLSLSLCFTGCGKPSSDTSPPSRPALSSGDAKGLLAPDGKTPGTPLEVPDAYRSAWLSPRPERGHRKFKPPFYFIQVFENKGLHFASEGGGRPNQANSLDDAATVVLFSRSSSSKEYGAVLIGDITSGSRDIEDANVRLLVCFVDKGDPRRRRWIDGSTEAPRRINSLGKDEGGQTTLDGETSPGWAPGDALLLRALQKVSGVPEAADYEPPGAPALSPLLWVTKTIEAEKSLSVSPKVPHFWRKENTSTGGAEISFWSPKDPWRKEILRVPNFGGQVYGWNEAERFGLLVRDPMAVRTFPGGQDTVLLPPHEGWPFKNQVPRFRFSPQTQTVVTYSDRTARGEPSTRRVITPASKSPRGVEESSLETLPEENVVQLWTVINQTLSPGRVILRDPRRPNLLVSPDGKTLLVVLDSDRPSERAMLAFDLPSGKQRCELRESFFVQHLTEKLQFSADSTWMAMMAYNVETKSNFIVCYSLLDGQLRFRLDRNIDTFHFHPNRREMVLLCSGHFEFWSIADQKLQRQVPMPSTPSWLIGFAPDRDAVFLSQSFVVGTNNRREGVLLWDLKEGKAIDIR